jgi:ABC-type bacteriocin/lantibiotic exporter with double-glycine peptidase domain
MKLITLFFTAFAIYLIWHISKVSLGYAVLIALFLFFVLLWLNKPNRTDKIYERANKAARQQNELINKK